MLNFDLDTDCKHQITKEWLMEGKGMTEFYPCDLVAAP